MPQDTQAPRHQSPRLRTPVCPMPHTPLFLRSLLWPLKHARAVMHMHRELISNMTTMVCPNVIVPATFTMWLWQTWYCGIRLYRVPALAVTRRPTWEIVPFLSSSAIAWTILPLTQLRLFLEAVPLRLCQPLPNIENRDRSQFDIGCLKDRRSVCI